MKKATGRISSLYKSSDAWMGHDVSNIRTMRAWVNMIIFDLGGRSSRVNGRHRRIQECSGATSISME